jgi:hypothetical protein
VYAIRPWVDDDGLGVAGIAYKVSPSCELTVEAASDLSEPIKSGLTGLTPSFIKRSYLGRTGTDATGADGRGAL